MGSGPLSDPAVQALARRFFLVSTDTDRPEHRGLIFSGRLRVDDIPGLAFFTPRGSFAAQLPANHRMQTAGILAAMRAALAEGPKIDASEAALLKAVRAAPAAVAPRDALARFLIERRRVADAVQQLELAFELARGGAAADADARLAEVIKLHLRLRQLEQAEAQIKRFGALFPASSRTARVRYYRGLRAMVGRVEGEPSLDQLRRAVAIFRALAEAFPRSRYARRGLYLAGRVERELADAERWPEAFTVVR